MNRYKNSTIIQHVLLDEIINLENHGIKITIGYIEKFRTIYVFTNKPGLFIGLHGATVHKMEEDLKSRGINKKIEFIELGEGYPKKFTFTTNPFIRLYRRLKYLLKR